MTSLYAVFHMNLAFSAVSESQRPDVIRRCYHPMLDLVAQANLPLGIECSGWSLEAIQQLDPAWIQRFRALLAAGRCELIGSGYMQIIGPLVPDAVNRSNQEHGLAVYADLLGVKPRLALVNEMALSSGLIPDYVDAGYQGLIFERENLALALDQVPEGHCRIGDEAGSGLPLLFSDSILFQKFQRYVHGQIPQQDLTDYLAKRVQAHPDPTAIYCSDAEIFDFRPKRYAYEEDSGHPEEWGLIRDLLQTLTRAHTLVLPSEALRQVEALGPAGSVCLSSARYPLPVKKQPKYNLARWAVSGRDDLWLNTRCHQLLAATDLSDPPAARRLLKLWSSDLRTHVDKDRFAKALTQLHQAVSIPHELPLVVGSAPLPDGVKCEKDPNGFDLCLATPFLKVVLNLRRGLTIKSLAFAAHDFLPVVGTLPHGYFRRIDLGADFYSGGLVIETTQPARRYTDLAHLPFQLGTLANGNMALQLTVDTPLGPILKTISLGDDLASLQMDWSFPDWQRPVGLVRLGNITLLPETFDTALRVRCHNGGAMPETYFIDGPCRHGAAISSLVSSTAGFGATTGSLTIGDRTRAVHLQWDPAQCAAMPMLWHEPAPPTHLTRMMFSLAELDDTRRPGGTLPSFSLTLRPAEEP